MTASAIPIDKLHDELTKSFAQLRELSARARTSKPKVSDAIGGMLVGPVSFPDDPQANSMFHVADAVRVHIPTDSPLGVYHILFGVAVLSPTGRVVARTMMNWPVEPRFGPDFGWAPTALEVPGQPAGDYVVVSLLTLVLPDNQSLKLDSKTSIVIISA
jgi:hypothetical protein